MASGTNIEWTQGEDGTKGATWNPVTGCTRVSAGCDHCYSARMTYRLEMMGKEKYTGLTVLNGRGDRHFNGEIKCHYDELETPLRWKKPRRIFVNSMSDTFHKDVPFEFIDRMFAVMALCPQHTFQVLTKRPERMAEYLNDHRRTGWSTEDKIMQRADEIKWDAAIGMSMHWPLSNVWLGTSVEDQKAADERIPHLLACPAAVRFLSVEPLLGPIEFSDVSRRTDAVAQLGKQALDGIHWVIVGGESGPGARPCDIDWVRSIIGQCRAAGVPVFNKQLGAKPYEVCTTVEKIERGKDRGLGIKNPKGGNMAEWPEDLRVREFPKAVTA